MGVNLFLSKFVPLRKWIKYILMKWYNRGYNKTGWIQKGAAHRKDREKDKEGRTLKKIKNK